MKSYCCCLARAPVCGGSRVFIGLHAQWAVVLWVVSGSAASLEGLGFPGVCCTLHVQTEGWLLQGQKTASSNLLKSELFMQLLVDFFSLGKFKCRLDWCWAEHVCGCGMLSAAAFCRRWPGTRSLAWAVQLCHVKMHVQRDRYGCCGKAAAWSGLPLGKESSL